MLDEKAIGKSNGFFYSREHFLSVLALQFWYIYLRLFLCY